MIERNKMTIHSKPLISELKSYVASGSSYRAKTGEKDDLVSASLLAMRIIQVLKDWDPKVYTSFSQADEDTTERVIETMTIVNIQIFSNINIFRNIIMNKI